MSDGDRLISDCRLERWNGENMEFAAGKRKKMADGENDEGEEDLFGEICPVCKQKITDPETKWFAGLPEGAMEEEAALTDDRLQLYRDGGFVPEVDIKPLHKLTSFTVFDGEGHICPFDTGLIERDELIFFSGYIKPIYEDDPSPKNGVPAQELGPIVEWWISGFDGGNSFLIGFRSPYAEYVLMEPSPEYRPFMRMPKQKALLTKIVIEFLGGTKKKPTYEELLARIDEVSVPDDIEPFDGQSLGRHARFIIGQIRELDSNNKMASTPAVQEMMRRFKIGTGRTGCDKRRSRFKDVAGGTITTTPTMTPLIRRHFRFFLDRKVRPRTDEIPNVPDANVKSSKFTWEENEDFAVVNGERISVKDFVFVNAASRGRKENRICRIEGFFQRNFTKQAHCTEFARGTETVLGDASDPFEIFRLAECSDWPICKIVGKVRVVVGKTPNNWPDFLEYRRPETSESEFLLRKKYSAVHGTFEDYDEKAVTAAAEGDRIKCPVCVENAKEADRANGIVVAGGKTDDESGATIYEGLTRAGEEYVPGCCVFLEPFAIVFDSQKSSRRIERTLVTLKADESIYPEMYRKSKETSLSEDCPEPFVVGRVNRIFSTMNGSRRKFFVRVNKFYRPENTRVIDWEDERTSDLRLLYWSEEEAEVELENVRGRCDVVYSDVPPRFGLGKTFYFNEGFDSESETFYDLTEDDVVVLGTEKETFPVVDKLKTLNAFSGCGGLAEGLRTSGAAEIAWAVEIDKATSKAFKLNFPKAEMFETDCNHFLRNVLAGRRTDENGNRYPRRGEVEFLCGGPPCQGFSTMNRFSSAEESRCNNSLILTYLSFCDYYRPKFFLLENVRNFASYGKSSFLRHALACLIAMGYQCGFGVLQAGNYGLPQTRRRVFIMAAFPGHPLPRFPKPANVFYGSVKNSEIEIGGENFTCAFSKSVSGSAPFRHVTIRDAIFDLPAISGVTPKEDSAPRSETTFYQKSMMGSSCGRIGDHVTKEMSPINEARIRHVPAAKGCDWRDLPNIRVRLRDGTVTDLLRYEHHDRKNGKSCCGLLRGVCGCASGKPCDPKDRQANTLIPWFLVHTANRNNNWTGLYGRLDWRGIFNTVTTNPEPSSQQGKVLHPNEDRVVSVRECARAQGMPDSFRFYGTVADKFRQVGNAVPPPIARAIGCEIRKCLSPSQSQSPSS